MNSARLLVTLLAASLAGCTLAREPSKTPRTAVEQLLLSYAVERGLQDLRLPIPDGSSVFVEVAGFTTHLPFSRTKEDEGLVHGFPSDLPYVRDAVSARLGRSGYHIRPKAEEAAYRVTVMIHALGTEQGETFFGMPPVQSVIIPFSLPELTLYKEQDQTAHMRVSFDVYETETGQLLRSTPWYAGSAYYHQYTFLFFFRVKKTDMALPP
jgi:hypothetical protein